MSDIGREAETKSKIADTVVVLDASPVPVAVYYPHFPVNEKGKSKSKEGNCIKYKIKKTGDINSSSIVKGHF
jgi:hypothetical protein